MKVLFKLFIILLSVICVLTTASCGSDIVNNPETESKTNKENSETFSDRVTAEGIVVVNNGSYLIIEDGSPIEMHTVSDKSIFEGLTTGDKIRIERDGKIMESFPGQVYVYDCEKVSDGDIFNIPYDLRITLSEIGWIMERDYNTNENDKRHINETVQTDLVTYNEKDVLMSIRVPEDWSYKLYSDDVREGLVIYPPNSNGKLELMYYNQGFATCGTEMRSVESTLSSGHKANKIYYGDSQIWTYVVSDNFALINMLDDETFLSMRDDIELMEGSVILDYIKD